MTTNLNPDVEEPMKNLAIFPGIGNPHSEEYSPVYDLLKRLAQQHGYHKIEVLTWPGQGKADNKLLNFSAAFEVAFTWARSQESRGIKFDILGRSFGTLVAMNLAVKHTSPCLNRIICWGPSPFSTYWDYFVRRIDETTDSSLDKGTRIDHNLFDELIPMEFLAKENKYPVKFIRGDQDALCPESFFHVLQTICVDHAKVEFGVVTGAKHEVKPSAPSSVLAAYEAILFSTGETHE
jgi:hypothetical protein